MFECLVLDICLYILYYFLIRVVEFAVLCFRYSSQLSLRLTSCYTSPGFCNKVGARPGSVGLRITHTEPRRMIVECVETEGTLLATVTWTETDFVYLLLACICIVHSSRGVIKVGRFL